MGSSFQNYAQNPTSQKEGKSSAFLAEKVEKKKKEVLILIKHKGCIH